MTVVRKYIPKNDYIVNELKGDLPAEIIATGAWLDTVALGTLEAKTE